LVFRLFKLIKIKAHQQRLIVVADTQSLATTIKVVADNLLHLKIEIKIKNPHLYIEKKKEKKKSFL
jgi:hypothetical protein